MERSYFGHYVGLAGWFARAIQAISAIIVLGITAWAVRGTKSVTVIYSLVVATLTVVVLVVAPVISCTSRRYRWHIIPLILTDGVLSYLWLTSFIFLALNFNRTNCRRNRWNGEVNCSRSYAAEAFSFLTFITSLIGLALEIIFLYHAKPKTVQPEPGMEEREERISEGLNEAV
ncbi:hypothetical protein PENFLA_c011G07248 [Penicillium flavigenum]|uniref:MARVEL domain-containing protein n=1 Tax=Penicillium flavigenum TaxID=254877 RepID=A0A1V6TCJ8_9EURO|nr:hypothetical protein PENFLA_c011G07248 [Penicillium flavigenum]